MGAEVDGTEKVEKGAYCTLLVGGSAGTREAGTVVLNRREGIFVVVGWAAAEAVVCAAEAVVGKPNVFVLDIAVDAVVVVVPAVVANPNVFALFVPKFSAENCPSACVAEGFVPNVFAATWGAVVANALKVG